MNSRERIFKALNREIPDRVPTFELLIDEASIIKLSKLVLDDSISIENIKTRFGEESRNTLELHCRLAEKLGLDSITVFFSTGLNNIDDNIAIDRFGTKYHLSEHGQPLPFEGPIKSIEDTTRLSQNLMTQIHAEQMKLLKKVMILMELLIK